MKSKYVIVILSALTLMGLGTFLSDSLSSPKGPVPNSIYEFKLKSLDGKEIDFAQYKGHKLLIVNTASKCGFTPQYAGLETLYERREEGLWCCGHEISGKLRRKFEGQRQAVPRLLQGWAL